MNRHQLLNHLLKEENKTSSGVDQNKEKGLDNTALVFLSSIQNNQNHRRRKKVFENYYQFKQIY